MSSYTVILFGSLPTEQIRPSITGLYRDPPTHETVSQLQQGCNQRMLFMLPVRFERFVTTLQRWNS